MALTRFIGDIHGNWNDYLLVTEPIRHDSVQVGDFGIGFNGPYWHDRVNEYHSTHTQRHRFIRGNHDFPMQCRTEMHGYIPDGTVENDVMYIGGAWSIDLHRRTNGVDWWPDEELTDREFSELQSIYETAKPRVVVTHDCPTLIAYYLFVRAGLTFSKNIHLTRTGEALQKMFEAHQPEHWIFGHWHYTKSMVLNGTKFQCLGINDFIDMEL